MLIVYVGRNEVIVTTAAKEAEMLKVYFADDSGRDVGDYDREGYHEDAVTLEAVINVR